MFAMRLPSIFGTKDWISIPYAHRNKGPLEYIIDVITLSSGLLYRTDRLREIGNVSDAQAELEKLRQEAQHLMEQLDALWETLRGPAAAHRWRGDFFDGKSGVHNPTHFPDSDFSAEHSNYVTPTVVGREHDEKHGFSIQHQMHQGTVSDRPQTLPVMQLRHNKSSSQSSWLASSRGEEGALSPTKSLTEPGSPLVIREPAIKNEDDKEESSIRDSLSSPRWPSLMAHSTSTVSFLPTPTSLHFMADQARNLPPLSKAGAAGRPLAFYSTARLIVLSLLSQLGVPPPLCDEQMEAHSGSVLQVAHFMTEMQIGYAFLRLIMALHAVAVLSPKVEQKEEAIALLREWKEFNGVSGLCDVALGQLERSNI
jgi:hypothetical protein